jgi:hypothetical protein
MSMANFWNINEVANNDIVLTKPEPVSKNIYYEGISFIADRTPWSTPDICVTSRVNDMTRARS